MQKKGERFRIVFNAPAVLVFALLCLIALVLSMITGGSARRLLFSVYRSSLARPLTWLRFFGHALGHKDWEHFFGNIMYILILGPMLEEKYGSSSMVFLMLVTAFVTGLLTFLLAPGVAMCGASGIVFAMILLSSFTEFHERTIPLTVILVAALYIGQQVYNAVTVGGSVAYGAHIVGGVIGTVIGYAANKKTTRRAQGR
ncbi:MAG: rhomboid family intramembrane serine protease [Clostridia bacterium]|nr:rhomboid family intramembrane serine protease [Clostridia bacterium]